MRLHRCGLPLLSGASAAAVVVFFLLVVQLFVAAQQQHEEDPQVGLKVTLRKESLEDAPSCMHTFAQLELLNLVSPIFLVCAGCGHSYFSRMTSCQDLY